MTKAFYISLAALLLIGILDFWTFRSQNVTNSIANLFDYTESSLEETKEDLLSASFLELVSKDSLNNSELGRLKTIESRLKKDFFSAKLYAGDKIIFWTEKASDDAYCKFFRKNQYKIRLCLDLFDENSELKQSVYSKAKVHHLLSLSNIPNEGTHSWNGFSIQSNKTYRSYRINNVLILCYLLFLMILIWEVFKINTPVFYSFLALVRALLFSFDNWHERFSNSSMVLELFEWRSYGNLDLLIDLFILFCILLKLSNVDRKDLTKNSFNIKLIFSGILLSLLIISHIRLIQHIALCDNFNITINDISSINIPEASIFIALILFLTGIFIYSVQYLKLLKAGLNRNTFYLALVGIAAITCLLSLLFEIKVHTAYMSLFLICFFILVDLFVDLEQKTVTWIIWWAIFFGMYLSSAFFNYDIQKQTKQRKQFLFKVFNDVDQEHLNAVRNSHLLDSISLELENLMILPDEAHYNKNDLNNYLKTKFGTKAIRFDVLKSSQQLFGQWPGKDICEEYHDLYFDEISNILWKEKICTDSLVVYAGIQIKKGKELEYPLLLIKNGKEFNFNFDEHHEEIKKIRQMDQDQFSLDSKLIIRYIYNEHTIAYSEKRFESLVKPIALFSYLFTSIILLFLLISLLSNYFDLLRLNWPLMLSQFQSLNSRIQTALILVILLSFIFIAAVTSSFIISFIDSKNNQFITEKLQVLSNDLKSKLRSAESHEEALIIANNYKDELERIHNTEIEIYSFSNVNTDVSHFPYAYFKKKERVKAFSEFNESRNYTSFFPVRYDGTTLAYLKLKMSSDSVQGFNIYDFLGSIFNVYVFLFLIASVFAIFIARSITKPLSLLNQKLSALRLGKRNELVKWEREDEMGTLINNYNNMVQQLENSVELLAKTERDNAWREMAKQVAHEIKNPLTPMKMYIQHLEKAIKQQPDKAVEISKKISSTLLEQVENLTQIADSFSNFAELPQSSNEKLELNKVVELVHNLFRKRDDMDIKLSEPIESIHVYADKNQLIRILNNLVKNAIESIPKDRKGNILLELSADDDKATIKVVDNGSGIPREMYDKVFQPKFTTKDSGSGLGLAIAVNMIESMNGRLYFKSELDKGTTFFIELDVIRKKFNDEKERISLD